jgi:hypothetical protein
MDDGRELTLQEAAAEHEVVRRTLNKALRDGTLSARRRGVQ